MGTDGDNRRVIQANVELHTRLAGEYERCEPHFRPENVAKVETVLTRIFSETSATRMLDLGCGTGFLIRIGKKHLEEIHGVDVTEAMLGKVDTSGDARVVLHKHDTGSFPARQEYFDVVTAYSFLHHLYEIEPTLGTAFRALKSGGKFYADLEPNFYFWEAVASLDRSSPCDPIVKREIEMVTYKDEDIQATFGVDKETFNQAEYGKNVLGGFREEELERKLRSVGFREVEIFYYWFIGQAFLINNEAIERDERFRHAEVMDEVLRRVLPLSRPLYKYLGFIATK